MPAGPDETDDHPVGAGTEHVMKDGSSKTDSNASTHPMHQKEPPKGDKVDIRYHEANPGPAQPPKDFNAKEEGTKAEREARAKVLNNE